MKDYRAATWALVATAIMVLTAASVFPATAAILSFAAGCSGLAFLHALLNPRTETIEIQLGAVNIAPPAPPNVHLAVTDEGLAKSDDGGKTWTFIRPFGGAAYGDRSLDDAGVGECPIHGFAPCDSS